MDFAAQIPNGLSYEDFLAKYATNEQQRRWQGIDEQVTLTDAQRELLAGFTREMHILILAGTWCGDCVSQCPILRHFAQATDTIKLHFFDRDDNPELAETMMICGGKRVPSVVFLSEDGFPCGRYGDKTLSKFQQLAADLTGAACPTGLVNPATERLAADVQDWLNEFERIQLMLRLSGRLREKHGD